MNILIQNTITRYLLVLFALLFVVSCDSNNRLNIDVSKVDVDIKYDRLDESFFTIPIHKDSVVSRHFFLLNKYPELYKSFIEVMLQEGYAKDTITALRLVGFLTNKDIQEIYKAIDEKFPSPNFLEEEFTDAFKHYHYYFPEESIPSLIGFYSNYNAKTIWADSSLAIGLELYLGENHPVTQRISSSSLPLYLKQKMSAEYMVSDVLKYFLLTKYYRDIGEDFLSTIVSMGKILYLVNALQPQTEDWKKMGYQPSKIEWCEDNEDQIWKYIVDEQLLFSVNQERINHFIDEGPFTKGLPQESPPMVGIWIGWQMVRDYMNENEDVTLQELIEEKDSKKILNYYQPN